jgi:hypothetical protein
VNKEHWGRERVLAGRGDRATRKGSEGQAWAVSQCHESKVTGSLLARRCAFSPLSPLKRAAHCTSSNEPAQRSLHPQGHVLTAAAWQRLFPYSPYIFPYSPFPFVPYLEHPGAALRNWCLCPYPAMVSLTTAGPVRWRHPTGSSVHQHRVGGGGGGLYWEGFDTHVRGGCIVDLN